MRKDMNDFPRTIYMPTGPFDGLPLVHEYECLRADGPVPLDGSVDTGAWRTANWSGPFVRLERGGAAPLESRIALLWDDECLYAAFRFEDPDIRAVHTEFHDHIYLNDSDAEIFIQGPHGYYELGINAINTYYEVMWHWLGPVVERKDAALLDRFFSTKNFIYFRPDPGEALGRFGNRDYRLPGLKRAVRVDGSVNNPAVRDTGWSVVFALPWQGLADLGNPLPVKDGDRWRIGASRCQHFYDADGGSTHDDWAWNAKGSRNMHVPERWSGVVFKK